MGAWNLSFGYLQYSREITRLFFIFCACFTLKNYQIYAKIWQKHWRKTLFNLSSTHFSADSLQVTENRISGARFATKPWHIWEIIWCSVQQGWPTFRRRLGNGLLQENKRLREEAATCMSLPPVPQCMILLVLPSILSMTLQVNFKFADLAEKHVRQRW